jgi:hypothetical protein
MGMSMQYVTTSGDRRGLILRGRAADSQDESQPLPYAGGVEPARQGVGDGTVTGERLSGGVQWSNQPRRRGDGTMLPDARGVITTHEGAEVFFDLTGRTVFVGREVNLPAVSC